MKTGSWRTIKGFHWIRCAWRSDFTLRGSRASYEPRLKLNLGGNMAATRPVSGGINKPQSVTSDLHASCSPAVLCATRISINQIGITRLTHVWKCFVCPQNVNLPIFIWLYSTIYILLYILGHSLPNQHTFMWIMNTQQMFAPNSKSFPRSFYRPPFLPPYIIRAVLIFISRSIPSVNTPHVITFCPIKLSKLSQAFMN